MNINVKATNMELTEALTEYVNKKIASIEKFITADAASGHIEIGKTTQHHKQGEVFKAEYDLVINGKNFYSVAEKTDLYTAIDSAKEELVRQITRTKDKKQTLYKRGASSVKKMIKGISKRNPFTSK